MKPFNLETFDRQFNFRLSALIDTLDYKYDALSPEKNTVKIARDIPVRVTSNEGTPGDGSICTSDYVRITGGGEEITGVVIKVEKVDHYTTITFTDILQLFNHEVYLKADEVMLTYVEDYLYSILAKEFITTTDDSQKIYGLNITKTSQTEGVFDYCYTDNMYTIVNLLNDYINPMFRDFLIGLTATINISNKTIDVVIGKIDETDVVNLEADLPNVIDSNFVIRQSNDNKNKLELIDTYNNQYNKYSYYLHASDYSFNQTNNDRITPVLNDIAEFDSSVITEDAFWKPYDDALDIISRYNSLTRELTTAEQNLLLNAFNEIFFIYQWYANTAYNDSWLFNKLISAIFIEAMNGRLSATSPLIGLEYHAYALNYSDSQLLEWMEQNNYALIFALRRFTSRSSITWNKVSYEPVEHNDFYSWTLTGHGYGSSAPFLPEIEQHRTPSSTDSHIRIEVTTLFEIGGTYQSGWEPTEEGSHAVYDVNSCWDLSALIRHDITTAEINTAINAYKNSSQYQSDFARYKTEKFNDILTAYANKIFKASKYSNNIEITVKQNDSMIKPLEMEVGQVVNIIHDGVSYSSILSGKEIKGGLVKLIFGTIRLELTKLLNMKGV